MEYCFAEDARLDLETIFSWTILGDTKNCVNAQPCSATELNTWDGSSSDDWNDPDNWSLQSVPAACDEVIIPDRFLVNLSADAECFSLEIVSGAELEVFNHNLIIWRL